MADIKITRKNNSVAIFYPHGPVTIGDPDGDFIAEAGTTSSQISVKRAIDDKYLMKDVEYTSIKDDTGAQIGVSRDNCVSTLNTGYFDRSSKLKEIDNVNESGALAAGNFLRVYDTGGGVLRWIDQRAYAYEHINGCFFDNTIRDVYLPIQGTENEYTTLQRWSKWVAPYDCEIVSFQFRREWTAATSGTVTFGVYTVNTGATVTLVDGATITPNYGSGETSTITVSAEVDKGDTVAFQLRNALNQAMGNCMFSITIRQLL